MNNRSECARPPLGTPKVRSAATADEYRPGSALGRLQRDAGSLLLTWRLSSWLSIGWHQSSQRKEAPW